MWCYNYAYTLEAERKFRYPNGVKFHRGLNLVDKMQPLNIPNVGLTPFALAMGNMKEERPDLYFPDDPVKSYRNFYMFDKVGFASWKNRPKPEWWNVPIS